MSLRDLGCRGFNKDTPVALPGHLPRPGDSMSTFMDLLFLGGYIATPTGLAAAVPELGLPGPHPSQAAQAAPRAQPPARVRVVRAARVGLDRRGAARGRTARPPSW